MSGNDEVASVIEAERKASLQRLLNKGKKILVDLDNAERKATYEDPESRARLDSILGKLPPLSSDPEVRARLDALEVEHRDETRGFVMGTNDARNNGPLSRSRQWVSDADEWAIDNTVDPLPVTTLPRPARRLEDGSWSDPALNGDEPNHPWVRWREVIANHQQAVRARYEVLDGHLGTLSVRRESTDRDKAGGWGHLRTAGVIDSEVLDAQLDVIGRRTTPTDIRHSIGASKELTEACLRGWLRDVGLQPADIQRLDLPQLFSTLRREWLKNDAVAREIGDPSVGVGRVMIGLGNVISGMAEIRNGIGTGHGTPEMPEGVTAAHAGLMADLAFTVTSFVAAQHAHVRDVEK